MCLVKKMRTEDKVYQVAVIGGGASGMLAAIAAARRQASVLLLEQNDRPGKKLLSTGNGKCNYINEKQGISFYRGDDPAFVMPVFSQFDKTALVSLFAELGIYPFVRDGYYYPYSGQASAVQEILEAEVRRLGVSIACGQRAVSIQKRGRRFLIATETDHFQACTCIVAAGGLAAPKTGSDGFGLRAAKAFGHRIVPTHPSLVPLTAKGKFLSQWAGVRARGRVSLYVDGHLECEDEGELQLTKDGISGIPVFQVSRFAAAALDRRKRVEAKLDFFPEKDMAEFSHMLAVRMFHTAKNRTVGDALLGLLNRKLHGCVCQAAGLHPTRELSALTDKDAGRLARAIKTFPVSVTGTRGYDFAQTTAGGVSTAELIPETMESRLCGGLYFAGETVDIDGICGGYNLQWAWSSGYVAGYHAAEAADRQENR